MNANTAMQWNNYAYQVNVQNSANEIALLNRRQNRVNETADATFRRLRDNPTPHDIHTGSALNVILTDLANPAVSPRSSRNPPRRSTASWSRPSIFSTPQAW